MQPDPLTQALFRSYQRTGKELKYWAHRFRQTLEKNGGLVVAKRIIAKKSKGGITEGLQKLIDANRPELAVESIILSSEFRDMFSKAELETAKKRITDNFPFPPPHVLATPILYPDDLPERHNYYEGAVARVLVNRYERDPHARTLCLRKHGTRCQVCSLLFKEQYGEIGNGFIHVHHVRPLAIIRKEYKLDPEKDLIPVCPNCHAMLHRREPPFSIFELKERLNGAGV